MSRYEAAEWKLLTDVIQERFGLTFDGVRCEILEARLRPRMRDLHLPELRVSCTAVRVPVVTAHSEAVHVELQRPLTAHEARELFAAVPGVIVRDDPAANVYPLATEAAGRDEVFVGRIRQDPTVENGIALFLVCDNLRKGAALNAVQIVDLLTDTSVADRYFGHRVT